MIDKIRYAAIMAVVFFNISLSAQEISVAQYKGGKTCALSVSVTHTMQ